MSGSLAQPVAKPMAASGRLALRAGPLAMEYEDGGLRYVRLGEREVVRRIYAAVRDRDWGTVPAEISGLQASVARNSFHLRFRSTHRRDDIHFEWRAELDGDADGTIRFTFDGEARTSFLRNRIGCCVLHPPECAGERCLVGRGEAPPVPLEFPRLVEAGQPVPGIHDLTTFAHQIAPGLWAKLHYTGDRFEMEDQRNWIDASFKTYCTPLHLPYPAEVSAGTRIRQTISLQLVGHRPLQAAARRTSRPVRVAISSRRRRLPAIGLGSASHQQPLTAHETGLIGALRLGHLRADVQLGDPRWPGMLESARRQSAQLRLPLELAVHLPVLGGENELDELVRRLCAGPSAIARVLLFRAREKTLSAASLSLARPRLLRLAVPIGAGTDADFYQLNQCRPRHDEADFVHWSMNPQVHAFDCASIAETPAAIGAQLESARVYFRGKPLVVSPVTLKPRFNAVATTGETPPLPGALPPQVDVRQLAPFTAAWTLAAIKGLAENGADSVTLFETTGWRGVLERAAGSPLPEAFPSRPGQLFPLYHILAELGGFAGGEVVTTRSDSPLRVVALALAHAKGGRLLLANFGDQPETVRITGAGRISRVQVLDWAADDGWMRDPQFVSRLPFAQGADRTVKLPAFALARAELELR